MWVPGVTPSDGSLCDVLLANISTSQLLLASAGDLDGYNTDQYEAIGIVVIPASHNVYGNGQPGVMALKSASCTTPDEGSLTEQMISWGNYQVDHSELFNYDKVITIGNYENWDQISVQSYPYLPSDNFTKLANPNGDPMALYYYNDSDYHAPSPYDADGVSRNSLYYSTAYGTNALSDLDGYGNTTILLTKATAEDWKTVTTLTNPSSPTASTSAGYQPAACACWRYSTVGTEQGDWYLPACGEFGYVCARIKAINTAISKINAWKPNSAVSLTSDWYWTSTEDSAWYARSVDLYIGGVSLGYRYDQGWVRPFLRVSF
jgi:hypothetical protein